MKHVFGLVALALAAVAPAAYSQAAGDIVARVRAINLDPADKDTIAITDVTVNSKVIPEVDFTYYFSPNLAAELVLTIPQKHDVRSTAHGGKIGTLKHLPPTLSAQYHFAKMGAFKPYLGAGLNFTFFSDVDLPAGFTIDKSSVGLALGAGFDVALGGAWSLNVDIKKVQIRTDLMLNGTSLGTIKVDPILFGVGVGYKF
ncbi:Outer membrane protein W precursor [Rubrivivax sp. A210]|uniref:OmpW/AlkL family protein n=1 Tax=Rubrivivax sp. A210 TaxID=2772301 RepID=UPI00191AD05F|nr:OmpW family outer membrane protein [Rubrivivax sp. A210]CAD5374202.1 Outer membrane protein W precursor [Rubrivivax sp. A210]